MYHEDQKLFPDEDPSRNKDTLGSYRGPLQPACVIQDDRREESREPEYSTENDPVGTKEDQEDLDGGGEGVGAASEYGSRNTLYEGYTADISGFFRSDRDNFIF